MAIQNINGRFFMDHFDFTTSAGDNDDIDAKASCIVVDTANNNDAITGIISETELSGEMLWLLNIHATNNLVLKHNDAGSTYKIYSRTGADVTVAPYKHIQLMYIDKVGRVGWWIND